MTNLKYFNFELSLKPFEKRKLEIINKSFYSEELKKILLAYLKGFRRDVNFLPYFKQGLTSLNHESLNQNLFYIIEKNWFHAAKRNAVHYSVFHRMQAHQRARCVKINCQRFFDLMKQKYSFEYFLSAKFGTSCYFHQGIDVSFVCKEIISLFFDLVRLNKDYFSSDFVSMLKGLRFKTNVGFSIKDLLFLQKKICFIMRDIEKINEENSSYYYSFDKIRDYSYSVEDIFDFNSSEYSLCQEIFLLISSLKKNYVYFLTPEKQYLFWLNRFLFDHQDYHSLYNFLNHILSKKTYLDKEILDCSNGDDDLIYDREFVSFFSMGVFSTNVFEGNIINYFIDAFVRKFKYFLDRQFDDLLISLETEIVEKIIDFNKQVRNHKQSLENAYQKAVYNFHDAEVISSLTLTLAHHNRDGQLSSAVSSLDVFKSINILFRKKYRDYYYNYLLNLGYDVETAKMNVKKIKYFEAFQLQTKNHSKGVWHLHLMINIDVLKIFGIDHELYYSGPKGIWQSRLGDSAFSFSRSLVFNKAPNHRYHLVRNEKIIVPRIFELWAESVRYFLPDLKILNPASQNVQVFYPCRFKDQNLYEKLEVRECRFYQKKGKCEMSQVIARYLAEYVAGIKDAEKRYLFLKQHQLLNKRLFQFSLSCIKVPVNRYLGLLPHDFSIKDQKMTYFGYLDFLSLEEGHYLRNLFDEHILHQYFPKVAGEVTGLSQAISKKIINKSQLIKIFRNYNFIYSRYFLKFRYRRFVSPQYLQTKYCRALRVKLNCFFKIGAILKEKYILKESLRIHHFLDPSSYRFENEVFVRCNA